MGPDLQQRSSPGHSPERSQGSDMRRREDLQHVVAENCVHAGFTERNEGEVALHEAHGRPTGVRSPDRFGAAEPRRSASMPITRFCVNEAATDHTPAPHPTSRSEPPCANVLSTRRRE